MFEMWREGEVMTDRYTSKDYALIFFIIVSFTLVGFMAGYWLASKGTLTMKTDTAVERMM